GEHLVPGVGGLDGGRDRLGVAHLPDHDDVGVLAERLDHAVLERGDVGADLAVADDAAVRRVHVLDGLRDDDDVPVEVVVVRVDDGVERGALARAGDAGEQREPVADVAEHHPPLDEGVEPEAGQRADGLVDGAHAQAEVAGVEVGRAAEPALRAGAGGEEVGEVGALDAEEVLALAGAEEVEDEDVDLVVARDAELVVGALVAVDAVPHAPDAGGPAEVHVGGLHLVHLRDEALDEVAERLPLLGLDLVEALGVEPQAVLALEEAGRLAGQLAHPAGHEALPPCARRPVHHTIERLGRLLGVPLQGDERLSDLLERGVLGARVGGRGRRRRGRRGRRWGSRRRARRRGPGDRRRRRQERVHRHRLRRLHRGRLRRVEGHRVEWGRRCIRGGGGERRPLRRGGWRGRGRGGAGGRWGRRGRGVHEGLRNRGTGSGRPEVKGRATPPGALLGASGIVHRRRRGQEVPTAYTIGNEAATAPAGIRGRGARPLPRPLLTARGRPPRREGGPAGAPLRGGSVALADLEVVVLSEVGVGAAPRDADDVLVGLVARRAVHDGDLLAVAATAGAPALEGRGRRGRRLDAAVVTAAAVVVTGRVVVAGRVVVGQVVVAAAGGRVVAGDAVHAALAAGDGGVHR